jgi:chorismate mutase
MEFLLKNSSKEKLTKRAEAIYNARSKTHCQFNFSIVQANNQDLNYYFPSTASMPGKAPKPIVSIYDYSINSIKERCESLLTHSGKNNSQSNLDYTYLIEATGKFKNNLEKRSTIHDSNFKVDANTLETLTKIEHLIGSTDPDKINEKKRTEMRILLDSLK